MAGIRPTAAMPDRWLDILYRIAEKTAGGNFVRPPSLADVQEVVDRLCAQALAST